MRASAALLGTAVSTSVVIALAVGACGDKSNGSIQPALAGLVSQTPIPTSGPLVCAALGAALTTSGRSFYFAHLNDEPLALEEILVVRTEGSQAHLLTSISFPQERIQWSSVVDCETGMIVEQQAPDFAYVFWPFPGVFVGQRLVESGGEEFAGVLPARGRRKTAGRVALSYRELPLSPSGIGSIVAIERRSSLGQVVEIDIDPGLGPIAARFAEGSALELVSEVQADAVAILLREKEESEEVIGAPSRNRLAGDRRRAAGQELQQGTADYSFLCDPLEITSYWGHWPEIDFKTIGGLAGNDTQIAGDDLTLLHDDRDSEFLLDPADQQWAHNALQVGQTEINVEWESVMMFPKHPYTFYNDTETPNTGNHFNGIRDISYQSPRRGDQVYVRGAVVVDCGHAPLVEVHPPVAMAWSHKFADGSADYFLRASSYGWYPHVHSFTALDGKSSFEADLDIPDASAADPGSTPYLGPVIVDYTYSGYDVSDDVNSDPLALVLGNIYTWDHPSAHLFGGDWSQPVSNYFDVSVTLNGSKVHIHAAPKSPWNVPHDDPQRPALIGIHFTACVPMHQNGVDLNGCGVQPAYELFGQVKPASFGGTVNGWVAEYHRPKTSLKVQVRGFAQCDLRDREGVAATASTALSNHTYSATLPQQMRICDPQGTDNVLEWVVRLVSDDERPQAEEFPLLHRYTAGSCVETPDIVLVSGLCPPGTGVNGGFVSCTSPYPAPTALLPYCEPGRSGQPVLPTVPAGFTATGGPNQITLSWQTNNAIEYEVYSADGVYSRIARTLTNSFTVSGLTNGVTHSYAVSGANSIGEGPSSTIATATTLHCSQNCSGCCSGETCNARSASTGCKINGQACSGPCPAGTDTCSGGTCVCHQPDWQVCDTTYNDRDYTRTCGSYLNACGAYISCGTCPPGNYSCTGGISAHCVCTPFTASQACGGACGTYAPNGCGGSVYCGACPCAPKTCSRPYIWDPDLCRCVNGSL